MAASLTGLQLFLNAVPERIHSRATAAICNHLLRGLPVADRLQSLDGKRLWLTISDTDTRLCYRFDRGRLQPDAGTGNPDLHIRGKLRYFLQLALRREDPDTLFFARHLSLEGNTEDGLLLKNFLDALEFDLAGHLEAVVGRRLSKPLLPVARRMQGFFSKQSRWNHTQDTGE